MSANKYKPHILVLPEDDANRQIANGFLLNPNLDNGAIRILPSSGGWLKAIESFKKNYLSGMRLYEKRLFLLLIDFDNKDNRLPEIQDKVPQDLQSRFFVLGSYSEPENLKKQIPNLKSFEKIGKALAEDCINDRDNIWRHNLLIHNKR